MRRRPVSVVLGVIAFVALAQPTLMTAAERHSGTVTAVDAQTRTLVVEEVAEEGKVTSLRILVAPDAQLTMSERIPDPEITDFTRTFRETPLSLSDIRAGDFVNVDVERRGQRLVARSVTVTLRSGSR